MTTGPDTNTSEKTPSGTPGEVLAAFAKLGVTAFGGPIAHLGYFRDEFVTRRIPVRFDPHDTTSACWTRARRRGLEQQDDGTAVVPTTPAKSRSCADPSEVGPVDRR